MVSLVSISFLPVFFLSLKSTNNYTEFPSCEHDNFFCEDFKFHQVTSKFLKSTFRNSLMICINIGDIFPLKKKSANKIKLKYLESLNGKHIPYNNIKLIHQVTQL